ncbi:CO or xanthine dehydrogenase, FAD-binding subunit [Caloramator quimbayensis]|uniref:CO or xanthine dehydrogenase, FAD-binding subunit n=1 Tax=Caloramator quimbayensis TaxID=1147123 RepID=A0A1T4Y7L5_9CLOT|nr:FAD binding domain-containing protein [Caloramator quimbayensis]SKA97710.1 CO or xanthine dehydrogenase, FAD-binding subunit [Caloramator quimbayensis]
MVKSYKPKRLEEALQIIKNEDCILFAGGTDLMVNRKIYFDDKNSDKKVLFLSSIEELKDISSDSNYIEIGSMTTLCSVEKNNLIPEALREAAKSMASPSIRNIATIGGNICNASPAGDTLPYLYAAQATLVLESIEGSREVYIGDFIKGPRKKDIKKHEILTKIKIPLKEYDIWEFRKVGTRKSTALSKLSFTGLAKKKDGILEDIRLSFGAVGPTVVRCRDYENKIIEIGKDIKIPEIIDMYSSIITPIDDQRSTAYYRKEVALSLLSNFLLKL